MAFSIANCTEEAAFFSELTRLKRCHTALVRVKRNMEHSHNVDQENNKS